MSSAIDPKQAAAALGFPVHHDLSPTSLVSDTAYERQIAELRQQHPDWNIRDTQAQKWADITLTDNDIEEIE